MWRIIKHIFWPLALAWFFLRLFFRLPWWIFAGLTVWVGWGTALDVQSYLAGTDQAEAQIATDAPALVSIGEFDPKKDLSSSGEVNVSGLYSSDDPPRDLVIVGFDLVYVPLRAPGSDEVVAVVAANKVSKARLIAQLPQKSEEGEGLFEVNGRISNLSSERAAILGDLALQRKDVAADLLVIRPFLAGREQAITSLQNSRLFLLLARILIVVILFVAMIFRFVDRREAVSVARAKTVSQPATSPAPPPASGPWGMRQSRSFEPTPRVEDDFEKPQRAKPAPSSQSRDANVMIDKPTKTVDEIIQKAFGTNMRAKVLQQRKD